LTHKYTSGLRTRRNGHGRRRGRVRPSPHTPGKRVFWGTDLSRLRGTYRQAVTLFTEELDFLSTTDEEWIMGRGIAEWLHWSLAN
jgi:hypothetical protein